MSFAIDRTDLISVRIILLCWTENLNKDITDLLTQRMYHAMYFFPDQDLQALAKKYPVEFKHFITSLRLIRNHPSLLLDSDAKPTISAFHQLHSDHHKQKKVFGSLLYRHRHSVQRQVSNIVQAIYDRYHLDIETKQQIQRSLNPMNNTRVLRLHPTRRFEVEATENPVLTFDRLWYQTFVAHNFTTYLKKLWETFIYENTDPQPVTSLMILLRNTARLQESLQLYVKVSNQVNSVDIFNCDVGIISLHYFWEFHAKQFHIIVFCIISYF